MAPQREAFVYGLVDPISRIPFYVGESTIGMRRPRAHASKGWTYDVVILEPVGDPTAPVASICPWLPEGRNPTALHEAERWWIALGRAFGWPLRNRTDGGEGTHGHQHGPETRAKMSDARRGRVLTPETREKISASRRGQPFSAEHRAKLSAIQVGQRRGPLSAETRAKIAAAKTGRPSAPFTSEHRAKLSAAAKAQHAKARMDAK